MARIALKMHSISLKFVCQSFPAPEYTACQYKQSMRPITPVRPEQDQAWSMTVPPIACVLAGRPRRYSVNTFPNASDGHGASIFMAFANIHSFHASGIDSWWISLKERSVRADLISAVSARSQSDPRACHSAPMVSHDSPASPTSSRTCCRAVGTPASPGGLGKYVSDWIWVLEIWRHTACAHHQAFWRLHHPQYPFRRPCPCFRQSPRQH